MQKKKKVKSYLGALRLERWPRSLAIIPGFVAFLVLLPDFIKNESPDVSRLAIRLFGAFLLTLLISTANYVINEIADAPYDAFHPSKKDRPLVKKEISVALLMVMYFAMVLVALLSAYYFYPNINFVFSLVALLVAGLLYNVPPVRMKDIPYLDSTLESGNNPIRFLIGWYILAPKPAPLFLLLSWWAFGNFLMVGKRVAEKKFLTAEESAGYRRSLQKYSLNGLKVFMGVNAFVFMATFCIFAWQSQLKSFLFSTPFILVYLIMFMKKSVQDIEGAEEPERLLKNPYFAFYTLFLVVIFVLAYIFK
ncbi:MAG: UbiA family prenyltransferase [bacterium]|nr:UbiA family prenyltransferase [bacterium]